MCECYLTCAVTGDMAGRPMPSCGLAKRISHWIRRLQWGQGSIDCVAALTWIVMTAADMNVHQRLPVSRMASVQVAKVRGLQGLTFLDKVSLQPQKLQNLAAFLCCPHLES